MQSFFLSVYNLKTISAKDFFSVSVWSKQQEVKMQAGKWKDSGLYMSGRGGKDRQGLGYDHCSLPVASP